MHGTIEALAINGGIFIGFQFKSIYSEVVLSNSKRYIIQDFTFY